MYATGEASVSSRHVPDYVGRFAPSPTGPLHFGSLIAAVASYLDAKYHKGRWLLRIDDIDTPRVAAGAADTIIATLEAYGFCWDGFITYQSQCLEQYQEVCDQLVQMGSAYPCSCSRRDLIPWNGIYPGTCRQRVQHPEHARSIRLLTDAHRIGFEDMIQGYFSQCLEPEVGDFVIQRADGVFTYQLAVVVDDAKHGVTHIVRGSDLLDSTPRQLYLQMLLGYPEPTYLHVPVAVDGNGHKLSKQTGAPALSQQQPARSIVAALAFLGQNPPPLLADYALGDVWHWAIANWRRNGVRGDAKVAMSDSFAPMA